MKNDYSHGRAAMSVERRRLAFAETMLSSSESATSSLSRVRLFALAATRILSQAGASRKSLTSIHAHGTA